MRTHFSSLPAGFISLLALLFILAGCGESAGSPTTLPSDPATSNLTLNLPLPSYPLTAAQMGVVVAEGDVLSEAIASYYQSARGIPAANIIRVKLSTGVDSISAANFATVKAEVDAKLPAGVQTTLLTWNAPSRVAGSCSMSITSAMAFGFDAKYCANTCSSTAASAYYDSESSQPWQDLKIRPAMMLGASSLSAAKALIDRGVQADNSQPIGDGYLLRTNDSNRSVRYTDYLALPSAWAGRLQLNYLDNSAGTGSNSISGKSNLLFYFTGLSSVANLSSNQFLPGAIADHLTSYGGFLPTGNGQMPISAWLEAGATASYGTVAEPCNFTQKFSRASILIDQYYRGATLIEAYWKAVEWPGQGLFVGEPLARPFADQASFKIVRNQYQISTRALRPNSLYVLEYLNRNTWTTLARFNIAVAKPQILSAPLAPASASQLRWQGPCPNNASKQCTLSQSF
ncbi:MAG: TIGR03790 family protein [Burkholderiales bacterium]|nr:TIGR03790 family protein [Burkholderiales bacterium]